MECGGICGCSDVAYGQKAFRAAVLKDPLVSHHGSPGMWPRSAQTRRCKLAIAELFVVALHALWRACDVSGHDVLVNGCGPIGVLAVAETKAAGAKRVVGADLSDAALIARRMGAMTG